MVASEPTASTTAVEGDGARSAIREMIGGRGPEGLDTQGGGEGGALRDQARAQHPHGAPRAGGAGRPEAR